MIQQQYAGEASTEVRCPAAQVGCHARNSLLDNLFDALEQWLLAKITEVIGPKAVVLLGTRVWRAPAKFREMPKTGHLEELGQGWTAEDERSPT